MQHPLKHEFLCVLCASVFIQFFAASLRRCVKPTAVLRVLLAPRVSVSERAEAKAEVKNFIF